MARFVLSWEKRAWLPEQVEIEVSQHDSVTDPGWPTNVDILAMNPPFKSWQLMSQGEQDAVSSIVGASSKPNLAMAFARRALGVLGGGGVLAMIAPNSLLEGASGRDTRETMATALNPQLVARLGDQSIFARALVDAGLYVGVRKPAVGRPTAILWADSRQNSLNGALRGLRKWRGAEVEPIKGEGFSVYLRTDVATTSDPWVARSYDAWSRYRSLQNNEKMVPASRLFDIRQGIRLGNDVFIVPKEYVQGLQKSERRFFRPAVMSPSIVDANLIDAHYSFYPYSEGLPRITSERELEQYVPKYFKEHLLPAKAKLKTRRTLAAQEDLKWWDLLRPRGWQMERVPKIVSKYFGGRRSFALDKTGEFVVVVGNAWLLKKGGVASELTDEEVYYASLTYLNSSLAYDLLEYLSIQVAGGQLDLSNKYVGELPIPDFGNLDPAQVSEMVLIGTRISERKIDRWSDVDEAILGVLGG